MKKTIGIAALLSCVLLTGCSVEDLKFWEKIDFEKLMFWKKEEEKPSPDPTPVEKSITISDIPLISVEDELDLTKFVTCEGGTGDFTVTIGESASDFVGTDVTGKKIFAEHSGEVPFTVNYSGISKDGSATFVSELYADFLADSENRGYDYAVYELDENWTDFESVYNYAENFMVDLYSGEGYVESEGKVYSFALEFDEEKEEISATYSISGYEPESLSEIVAPWSIDPTVLKCKYVPEEMYQGKLYEAYESLYIDDEETVNYITEYVFGYSVELLANYDFIPTKVEIEEDYLYDSEGNEEKAYDFLLYVYGELESGEKGEGLFNFVIVDLNEGAFFADDIAELFENEKPHGQEYGEFVSVMNSIIESKNYEVVYNAGWVDKDGQSISNPFVVSTRKDLGYYIHDYLMADGSLTAYVTETQTYIENGGAEHSYGLVAKDGRVYDYKGSEHNAELLSFSDNIFSEDLEKEASNYLFLHSKEELEDSYIEQLFANEFATSGNSGYISFSGSTAKILFANLFSNAIPPKGEINNEIKDGMEFLAQYNDISQTAFFLASEDMTKYLVGSIEYVENEYVTFSFVWEDADEENNEYYYVLSATFTNFGNAAIPGDVIVNYGK